ncbi:hypothetical protein Tco_0313581 [Tanacetum coccineum]
MNDIVSSDVEWEESDYGNPPNTTTDSFFKPYLNAQEKGTLKKRMNEAKRSVFLYGDLAGKEIDNVVIMEYLVKISKKARILELKQRHLKISVLTSNTPYPSKKIRRICACTLQETTKIQSPIRLLCHGESDYVGVVKKSVDEFSKVSSLYPNMSKSTIFFGSLNESKITRILSIMPFAMEKLPMKYLGVPLLAQRLTVTDCKILVDKVKSKVHD